MRSILREQVADSPAMLQVCFTWHAEGPGMEPGLVCDKCFENYSLVLAPPIIFVETHPQNETLCYLSLIDSSICCALWLPSLSFLSINHVVTLSFQTFPEPLTFNKERGGFEVVSNAKQALKARIRTIVRSQQKPNPIYAAASRVSSARQRPGTAPPRVENEDMDFKTSFTVQVSLNRKRNLQHNVPSDCSMNVWQHVDL